MKARIVEHLGQSAVILPALVREGLAANDRAKLRMAALQAAVQLASRVISEAIRTTLFAFIDEIRGPPSDGPAATVVRGGQPVPAKQYCYLADGDILRVRPGYVVTMRRASDEIHESYFSAGNSRL
jgi:hypothetical protein